MPELAMGSGDEVIEEERFLTAYTAAGFSIATFPR